mmetsp:Transcript_6371/g.9294  ORF Transcript_6371/g.9294 Transcript_6371/m.9294 type:complete len:83 (+) Transcript_6371:600-848(+)
MNAVEKARRRFLFMHALANLMRELFFPANGGADRCFFRGGEIKWQWSSSVCYGWYCSINFMLQTGNLCYFIALPDIDFEEAG